ncbi:Acetyl-/propionyl-coenzyme A carboxylase alpha chain [Tepidimonas alkaliphilus]|uniref:Acetyl-/propionyl-coenzyme A carboxylase alpha chain n=1 Tax=Tepidimonas alkaliphilus TaxID=2588942 RepID=A0A554WB81_9BURK|nr:acetyl/propionyl/methylcrotonyl-CoA carboxylase subunit alpha [Tepidimonas alkaliphilus]TSE20830.1 Acetyl-/propionyl-coenzyme A carboxylase alpha chain [Tepidimonas alkaliphilus]
MFDKILIANRGEIACRVAATARRLGVRTVAVYSEADARARHVASCDEAVPIGGAAARDSYLRWERILEAARATGAQAIHPGYGFLSENEAFAQACADAGLVFIGPPPQAIAAMGLKAEAKRLMEAAGVPLVPGYHGAEQDPRVLRAEAERIGWPVLIKASAGGGGKGMRRVDAPERFDEALAACQREAQAAFGNAAVLIERYVQRPRHVEIQIFADAHGHCVHLFERDCSVQRRHQKVLEEAPAPGLPPELRERMGLAAVAAARAVGYIGAGTVEFIVEQPLGYDHPEALRFYFMEMNTRLQVEHPVTEAITGLDLVEWQLRVAAGEPLPWSQHELTCRGHAIEARICAEDPSKGFLPATGRLQVLRAPAHVAFQVGDVRLDAGVGEGDVISPHYDSMIAKLIVRGDTRQQALQRLDEALARLHVVGVANNVEFLRRVVRSASFAQARLDTALIEREAAALFEPSGLPREAALAAAVAHVLHGWQAQADADPWSARDGFASAQPRQRPLTLQWNGQTEAASLVWPRGGGVRLRLGSGADAPEHPLLWRADDGSDWALRVQWGALDLRASVHADGERLHVFTPEGRDVVTWIDALAHAADAAGPPGGQLTAPMPGKVVAFLVQPGQRVTQGQALAVLEAMKMEHTIAAPRDGVVEELLYAPGDQVAEGAELLRLAAEVAS